MNKFKKAELKLNEYLVPTHFHDMSVVNMKFSSESIIIRFILAKYLDEFDILEDEKHFAILEVKYDGIIIKKMDLEGAINFRELEVLRLTNSNGVVELNLYNEGYDCYFNISFTCESFNWKVIDVVPVEEYYVYSDKISEINECLSKVREYKGTKWSNFED